MQFLPADWVDAIFARLQVRYGAAWTRQWEGVDINAVKTDWSSELAGYANRPEAIAHALNGLPVDRPPTAGQFLALCRTAPDHFPPALACPKPTPEQRKKVSSLLKQVRSRLTGAA